MKGSTELPSSLIESLQNVTGFDEEAFLKVHASGEQVTSIRLNPLKEVKIQNSKNQNVDPSVPQYAISDLQSSIIPWCSSGRYLSKRPSFTFDPSFHAGAYYVQEASSMFLDNIIKQLYTAGNRPERVLDLCAAPGGKSTLLASALPDSFIISNEVIKSRVTILAENISKWGSGNVVVTHNDPKNFRKLQGYFDLMVVDAPCSGSGLFRKDVRAIEEWSEANVEMCSLRQQRILADAIPALNKDGYLIYSTCSYSKEEDENICDWIVENLHLEPLSINVDPKWSIVETISEKYKTPGYRFYPDKLDGEGFFVACFKQTNETGDFYPGRSSLQEVSKSEREIIEPWFKDVEQLSFFKQKETIIAYPKKFEEEIKTAQSELNVRKSGVAVGIIKGKDLIPHHELALSHLLRNDFPFAEVNYEDAIRYLKRQDLNIELASKGWMLIRYNGLNIGWIKALQNRINNYYPPEWRILKY